MRIKEIRYGHLIGIRIIRRSFLFESFKIIIDAIMMSLRGVRFLARHCEPPVESGAKQSHLLPVCFLRKSLARNRLRNLALTCWATTPLLQSFS